MGEDQSDDPSDTGESVVHIADAVFESTGDGPAVRVGPGFRAEIEDSVITGRGGIENHGTVGMDRSRVDVDGVAYTGKTGSVGVIDSSKLDGDIADIVHHPGAQVVIYHSIATQILELTGNGFDVIDPEEADRADGGGYLIDEPELYHIAQAVLSADTIDEKDEHTRELFQWMIDNGKTAIDYATTAGQLHSAGELLKRLVEYVYGDFP